MWAGDDRRFAFDAAGGLWAMGKGLLGNGDSDGWATEWTPVPIPTGPAPPPAPPPSAVPLLLDAAAPATAASPVAVASIAGSSHFFVRLTDGRVLAFGENFFGQLGLRDEEDRAALTSWWPGAMAGPSGGPFGWGPGRVADVQPGAHHSVLLWAPDPAPPPSSAAAAAAATA